MLQCVSYEIQSNWQDQGRKVFILAITSLSYSLLYIVDDTIAFQIVVLFVEWSEETQIIPHTFL